MEPIRPELPPFIAPLVAKFVVAATYGGIGLIVGSLLGLVLRRLIYAFEFGESSVSRGLIVAALVGCLVVVTCTVLIAVFDSKGYAAFFTIGAVVGSFSFARPWWAMRR